MTDVIAFLGSKSCPSCDISFSTLKPRSFLLNQKHLLNKIRKTLSIFFGLCTTAGLPWNTFKSRVLRNLISWHVRPLSFIIVSIDKVFALFLFAQIVHFTAHFTLKLQWLFSGENYVAIRARLSGKNWCNTTSIVVRWWAQFKHSYKNRY